MSNLKTLGRFSIDIMLDLHAEWAMGAAGKTANVKVDEKIYSVSRSSQRYSVFEESLRCFACNLGGEYCLLQQNETDDGKKAHFNLYADLCGEPILFTKDHIIPRSKGGKDDLSNYRTMCFRCNRAKADSELSLTPAEILAIRYISESAQLKKLSAKSPAALKLAEQLSWLIEAKVKADTKAELCFK